MKSAGKILISIVAIYSALGSYIFDWNQTHIYNPRWSPHAKFHNAQTMLLGTCLGLFALWTLWVYQGKKSDKIRFSVILAGLYWITQAGSILFPGTALVDPEFAHKGQLPAQLIVDVLMLVLLAIGYMLQLKQTKI
ncbi:MAG: DUF6640 family protein [Chitinophagaceae bacterium]